jgi:hypothetical protein
MPVKTDLEYPYKPTDFFEVATTIPTVVGVVVVDGGQAVLTLAEPTDPVEASHLEAATGVVRMVLQARQLLIHEPFVLQGPNISQYRANGSRDRVIIPGTAKIVCRGFAPDILVTNAAGEVVKDTKAERLSEHLALVQGLLSKAPNSSTLQRMLQSYSRAVSDPDDELVHLYEIREAATEPYSSETATLIAIGVSKSDWSTLGRLANNEPLRQGRHRGKQTTELRDATEDELDKARRIARMIITAFAETL